MTARSGPTPSHLNPYETGRVMVRTFPRRPAHQLLLLLGAIVVTNAITIFVLYRNLEAGIYPPEADTIAIPIFNGALVSALTAVFVSIGIFLPRHGTLGRIASSATCAVGGALAGLFSLYWVGYPPHHYPMLVAYGSIAFIAATISYRCSEKQDIGAKPHVAANGTA